MIRLDSTSKLQAVLAGAVATTQPQAIVCYSDKSATGYAGARQLTALNSTTDVDICAAPAASTVRDVDFISIHNRDTATVNLTIKYDVSATDATIIRVSLLTLEQLFYTHSEGWKVLAADGSIKTSLTSSGAPSGPAGGDLTGTYPSPTIADGAIAFNELSDVVITSPATGATLIYDGANWIDGPLDLAVAGARTGTLPVANGGTGVTTSTGTGSTVLSADPTFTGVPAAPTAAAATNTTQIATTEFATTADNLKANIASPTFTGTVIVPDTFTIQDNADPTKQAQVQLSGITTGTTRTYTTPNATGTLALLEFAQTWTAAQTFTQNTVIGNALASTYRETSGGADKVGRFGAQGALGTRFVVDDYVNSSNSRFMFVFPNAAANYVEFAAVNGGALDNTTGSEDGNMQFYTQVAGSLVAGGQVVGKRWSFGGVNQATALVHLEAGAAGASNAPLKFRSGPLLTTPEAGAVEFLADSWYGTITTGAARKTFAMLEMAQTWTAAQTFTQIVNITNTTASTSSTTGALTIAGGLGVGGVDSHFGTTSTAATALRVTNTDTTGAGSSVFFAQGGSVAFGVAIWVNSGILEGTTAGGLAIGTPSTGQPLKFYAAGRTERARIEATAITSHVDVKLDTAGNGLYVKQGTNATFGRAVLVAGTVTVATTKSTSTMEVFLTNRIAGGSLGILSIGTVVGGTSFVINSSNIADTSTIAWIIVEPA